MHVYGFGGAASCMHVILGTSIGSLSCSSIASVGSGAHACIQVHHFLASVAFELRCPALVLLQTNISALLEDCASALYVLYTLYVCVVSGFVCGVIRGVVRGLVRGVMGSVVRGCCERCHAQRNTWPCTRLHAWR